MTTTATKIILRFELEKLENAAYLLKALVHPTRLAVIDLLDQHKEMSVSDFVDALDIAHPLLSHHLTDMKSKNILQSRREGQRIYYSIKERAVLGLLKCIQKL
jgi:ArsR family transcriptional regulator